MTSSSSIGLFGGTFDPIHYGHLRLAEEIADAFSLDQVRLVPASVPPHRQQPGASAQHRLAMTQLAIAGNPRLVADRRELDRQGASYTVDTLIEMRAEAGDRPLALLLGADAFVLLATWHRWEQLFELAHIIVARRPGFPLEQLATSLPHPLRQHYERRLSGETAALHASACGKVFTHELTALDVSATALRSFIQGKASLRYLLPDAVIAYIEDHNLYREPDAS